MNHHLHHANMFKHVYHLPWESNMHTSFYFYKNVFFFCWIHFFCHAMLNKKTLPSYHEAFSITVSSHAHTIKAHHSVAVKLKQTSHFMHYTFSKALWFKIIHIFILWYVHLAGFKWNVAEMLLYYVKIFLTALKLVDDTQKSCIIIHSTKYALITTFYLLLFSSQCKTTLHNLSFTLRSLFLSWYLCSLPQVIVLDLAGHWRSQNQGWSPHSRFPVRQHWFYERCVVQGMTWGKQIKWRPKLHPNLT